MYATGGARLHQVHTIAETNEHSHLSGGETRIVSLAEMELWPNACGAARRVQWRRMSAPAGDCQRGRRSALNGWGDLIANPIIAPSATPV